MNSIPSPGEPTTAIARATARWHRFRRFIAHPGKSEIVLSLPSHRHAVLQEELDRLDRTIERLFSLPGDLALARIPDSQGLGGSLGARVPSAD
jgi:hypothetical protein